MAGAGDTPELVSAVCNAGGLGFIGAAYLSPAEIIARSFALKQLTSKPFGMNLFAPLPAAQVQQSEIEAATSDLALYYRELGVDLPSLPRPSWTFEDQLDAVLQTGASAFSFAFGTIPSDTVHRLRNSGMYVMGTATTVKEAQALQELGVDAVIAQGGEAGGHRSTFSGHFEAAMIGTLTLVPQVADAISIPVIASGGIMDGRGVAAALVLGASAAQLGTAFLTCKESGVPRSYKSAILSATEDSTALIRAFSGRPARGIVNRVARDYATGEKKIVPFPIQNALTRPMRNAAAKQDNSDYLSLWAGQGLRMARECSAAELVTSIAQETRAALRSLTETGW